MWIKCVTALPLYEVQKLQKVSIAKKSSWYSMTVHRQINNIVLLCNTMWNWNKPIVVLFDLPFLKTKSGDTLLYKTNKLERSRMGNRNMDHASFEHSKWSDTKKYQLQHILSLPMQKNLGYIWLRAN